MASKTITLSDGNKVTICIDNFTRAEYVEMVKSNIDDYDKHLSKMVEGYSAEDLAALSMVDHRLIDRACGALLQNPVKSDPS